MTTHAALDDKWVWDFWFAVDGRDYHVVHLQAPRSLGDPDARHRNAIPGRAVSTDLRRWEYPDGRGAAFRAELCDPVPILVLDDGRLALADDRPAVL